MSLIDQALAGNRELKILDEEVQIASNEVLARQGAFLPFLSLGAGAGISKPSKYTPEGAAEEELTYPGNQHFPDPLPNFVAGLNLNWQIDIWRELRNARDAACQRYIAATERRNYFITHLVAEVAENYYDLVALDKRLENLGKTIDLFEQSLKIAKAKKRPDARPRWLFSVSRPRFARTRAKRRSSGRRLSRPRTKSIALQSLPAASPAEYGRILRTDDSRAERGNPRSCCRTDLTSARPSAS